MQWNNSLDGFAFGPCAGECSDTMASILTRLSSPFEEFGWFPGLIYSSDRVLQRISPKLRLFFFEFVAQPITEKALLPKRLADNFEIREIRRGDPEIELMPALPTIKESRFAQGAVCLGAFQNGKLAGYIWLCGHRYEEDAVRCVFVLPRGGDAVFDFDIYIFPERRMGLAFAAIWDGANEYLRKRGVKVSFSRLDRFNLASRRAHQQLGARPIGRSLFLQLGPIQLMLATIAPYLHLSLGPPSRVELKLFAETAEALSAQACQPMPGARS